MHDTSVVITGLPEEGITENDVVQYISGCGLVEGIQLFPASQLALTPSAKITYGNVALVVFRHRSSVPYATLLTGCLFHGKVIRVRTADLTSDGRPVLHLRNEMTAPEEGEEDAVDLGEEPVDDIMSLATDDIPETTTGLWLRARMRRVSDTVQRHAAPYVQGARVTVAKARESVLSLELTAVHAVEGGRVLLQRGAYFTSSFSPSLVGTGMAPSAQGDGAAVCVQYNYTRTQPQWGTMPGWMRWPVESARTAAAEREGDLDDVNTSAEELVINGEK